MRRFSLYFLAVAALLCAAPALAHAQDQIAVVDMLSIVEDHPDTKRAREELRATEKRVLDRFNKDREYIKQRQDQLEAMSENTQGYLNLKSAIATDVLLADHRRKYAMAEAVGAYARRLEAIYTAVRAKVMVVAQRRGLKLVLQKTEDAINAAGRDDFVLKVALRGVVWFDRSLDITEEVRRIL